MASARPSSRRARADSSRATATAASSPARGSVTSPVRKIFEKSTLAPGLAGQLAQQVAGAGQLVVEDPAGRPQQRAHLGIDDGVADGGAFLTRADDVLGAQDGELLRHA